LGATREEPNMTDQGKPDPKQVFVIHGRNEPARKALFDFLRSIGLSPIEWSQAIRMTGKGSPYIGEVLDVAFSTAQAVVVLETPDDVAYLHPSLTYPDDPDCDPQGQPRPNVLFEAGMAMGRDPDRTVLADPVQLDSLPWIASRPCSSSASRRYPAARAGWLRR
jgi:predicted nucleotide-binding protein